MPRPQRVTRELVLAAAMQIADAEGLNALTMRRLGRTVGAAPSMIYRIFASKDALVEALADQLFAQTCDHGPRDDAPRDERCPDRPSWFEQLRLAAHGIRRALLAHPALVAAAVKRSPLHEEALGRIDAGPGMLLAAGMDREAAMRGYQAVLSYTLGSTVLEATFAAASDNAAGLQAARRGVHTGPSAEKTTHVPATAEDLSWPGEVAQFDHGLHLLLTGLRGQLPHRTGFQATRTVEEPQSNRLARLEGGVGVVQTYRPSTL